MSVINGPIRLHTQSTGSLRGMRRLLAWGLLALLLMSVPARAQQPGPALSAAAHPEGSGSTLPDKRAYELVSAADEGEPYLLANPVGSGSSTSQEFNTNLIFRAAVDGEALAYVGEPGTTTGSGLEDHPGVGNNWLARRSPQGWQAEDITPSENNYGLFQSFSETDDIAFYQQRRVEPLAAGVEPGCDVLYARSTPSGQFAPLFTGGQVPKDCGAPLFAGATPDGSQVIFQTEGALTPGSEDATEADLPPGRSSHLGNEEECVFGCNLYLADSGRLLAVNVIEGRPVPGATFGGYSQTEHELPDLSNAISSDGSRVFWTDTRPGEGFGRVYAFENHSVNVRVSGARPAQYWTAGPAGRYAFYTEGGALWRFDTVANDAQMLTDESAEVQGVIGTNQVGRGGNEGEEEGAYVYFVANGVLTHTANSHGETASVGSCPDPEAHRSGEAGRGCNLYLLHEGRLTFIARLSASDNYLHSANGGFNQFGGDWQSGLGERLAEVTPNGQSVLFESIEDLTGYRSPGEGEGDPQVFVYSAQANSLVCASCSPDGEVEPSTSYQEQRKLPVSSTTLSYMHRWISSDGARVFFDSIQPLTPQATDGAQNVYEWERPASASEPDNTCTNAQASALTGGCTYLLSGGGSEYDSYLIDADATGDNVFFEHVGGVGQLQAPLAHNEIYDARVEGGHPVVSLACTGTGCQGVPPAPPVFATPASVTFSGVGNFPAIVAPSAKRDATQLKAEQLAKALKACHKQRKGRKRAACELRARKRYGQVLDRKSSKKKGR